MQGFAYAITFFFINQAPYLRLITDFLHSIAKKNIRMFIVNICSFSSTFSWIIIRFVCFHRFFCVFTL